MYRLCYFIFFFLLLEKIFAQTAFHEDPERDQLTLEQLNFFSAKPLTNTSSVLTVDNWDNFMLGIDMAENNMATHPHQPTWFFTAYNLNGTHHSENGFQWFSNNPNFAAETRGDPVVAYDSLGNLYYINMVGIPDIYGARVVRSADNGCSWETAVDAIAGYDKCWLACDQTSGPFANYVYATMSGGMGGNFSRSIDHGMSFQTTFQTSSQSLPGMMVCVGPFNHIQGGSVYVVTNSGSSFSSTYSFYRSLDGGETFSLMSEQNFSGYVGSNVGGRNAVENMRTRPYPLLSADNSYGPYRGRLYVIYASNNPPGNGNKPDIFCRFSDDGGQQWSDAVRVNDDMYSEQHHQWHPATWCDKESGRLYVQWMDTRDTPTSDSALIYATYSDNGGLSFLPNQKISNRKMKIDCSSCGGSGTPRYQGDYNGIISNAKISMLGWTDFREGSFMSTTAYFPDFAMKIDHETDTLRLKHDTAHFLVIVPEGKLYSDMVIVSAEIFPTPSNGSFIIVYPQNNVIYSFPDTIAVDILLNGSVPIGNYHINFFTRGPNGTPVHKREAEIIVEHGTEYYVYPTSEPDIICTGASAQLMAFVNNGSPPYSYVWYPPQGLSDPYIANPIASLTESKRYCVTVTDSLMRTDTDSIEVVVKFPPVSPGPISGEQQVCYNSLSRYSVSPIQEITSYSWSVPSGASIIEGQNTPKIMVRLGTVSGNVSVIIGNNCGTSNPSVIPVDVTGGPEIPGNILGPDHACANGDIIFYVNEATGATSYQWDVPPGALINTGQGSNEISVTWGDQEGSISVFAINHCGHGDTLMKTISLDSLPSQAQSIIGKDSVCLNHGEYFYYVPKIAYATDYSWVLPTGAEITSGKESNEIIIFFSQQAQSGKLTVAGKNDCGNGPLSELMIIVNPCIGFPEPNTISNHSISIYPNPADEKITLLIQNRSESLRYSIIDMQGLNRISGMTECNPPPCFVPIDISMIPRGAYVFKLMGKSFVVNSKLIIE